MIHIKFEEPTSQKWRDWRAKCQTEQLRHNAAVRDGRASKINELLYKGQKDAIYINLDGPFRGKCAYCEQKIIGDQRGDIEHFRPKAAVVQNNNKPIKIKIDGKMKNHPGYYWLVYDWKNLLPSCILCNQLSAEKGETPRFGKGNQFPVRRFRAKEEGEENLEEPLLLHPIFNKPEDHIEVDNLGVFKPKNKSDRGKKSMDIFGLNYRDLPNDRKKKYNDVKNKMRLLAHAAAADANSNETRMLLEEISEIKKGCDEFTMAARKAIKDSSADVVAVIEQIHNDQ